MICSMLLEAVLLRCRRVIIHICNKEREICNKEYLPVHLTGPYTKLILVLEQEIDFHENGSVIDLQRYFIFNPSRSKQLRKGLVTWIEAGFLKRFSRQR